jgi:hypothetical protein
MKYRCGVGYEWLEVGLQSLRGVEPHEVMQVIYSKMRRPRPTISPEGHRVLTIYGRTPEGTGVVIALRPLSQWDWQIVSARVMTAAEDAEHAEWEATRDDQ